MRSPMWHGITEYVCYLMVWEIDGIAEADINMPDGDIEWALNLEDWRGWELMLDWTGNLDADGVS